MTTYWLCCEVIENLSQVIDIVSPLVKGALIKWWRGGGELLSVPEKKFCCAFEAKKFLFTHPRGRIVFHTHAVKQSLNWNIFVSPIWARTFPSLRNLSIHLGFTNTAILKKKKTFPIFSRWNWDYSDFEIWILDSVPPFQGPYNTETINVVNMGVVIIIFYMFALCKTC